MPLAHLARRNISPGETLKRGERYFFCPSTFTEAEKLFQLVNLALIPSTHLHIYITFF